MTITIGVTISHKTMILNLPPLLDDEHQVARFTINVRFT